MALTDINLAEQVKGTLPVANGGTGNTTLTAAGIEQTANKGANNGYAGLNSSGAVTSPLSPGAGTTSVAPLLLTSGTNLTSPVAGAVEYDGTAFYQTPKASTRHISDIEQFITLTASYTLTSQTAAQKLFNSTTNGAVTLQPGTYFFECVFALTSLSGSSGQFGFALGGTATIAGQFWETLAVNAAATSATNTVSTVNTAANTAIVADLSNTNGRAIIRGKVRISVAGTLIPQVSLGSSAAAVVAADSWFRIWTVGSSTVTNVGNWS